LFAAVLLVLITACAPRFKTRPVEVYLNNPNPGLADVVRVLAGKSDAERRATLARILRFKEIEYQVHRYLTSDDAGANFYFELGSGERVIVVSAHYDAVPGSPGANDDASCVASVLGVYERLKTESLRGLKVRFVFFDDEELGLVGSKAYVRENQQENVIAMYSLEMCGIGDMIAVWDLKKKDRERPGIRTLLRTLEEMKFDHVVEGKIPRFGSDHRKFAERGIPAVALTVIPKRDREILREYIFQPNLLKWIDRGNRPYIFQLYHTENDAAESIEESALRLMADTVSRTILNLR
jgi:hypothetical protein